MIITKQIVQVWFWGSTLVTTWLLGFTGVYLFKKNENTLSASLMILAVCIFWVFAIIASKKKLIEKIPFEQIKGMMISSILFLWLLSLVLVVIVILTPDDPTARGSLFVWEQLIAYGTFILTILLSVGIKLFWNQLW